jgi:hypothetical protein
MEPKYSLRCLRDLATSRDPEPDESIPHLHIIFLQPIEIHLSMYKFFLFTRNTSPNYYEFNSADGRLGKLPV